MPYLLIFLIAAICGAGADHWSEKRHPVNSGPRIAVRCGVLFCLVALAIVLTFIATAEG